MIVDDRRRRQLGEAFSEASDIAQARDYDAVRPRYPQQVVRTLLEPLTPQAAGSSRVVELGAGTGILTRSLLAHGAEVRAVEPSAPMVEVMAERSAEALNDGRLRISRTSAESTEISSGWADLVVAAQSWHWFDPEAVQPELVRILRAGGFAAVIANHLDTSVPWVHRLTRIMRAGDVRRPGWRPDFGRSFGEVTTQEHSWERRVTPEEIHRLSRTLSSWLTADEQERARRRANLEWYLSDHLGRASGENVVLPYTTMVYAARLRQRGAGS
ncbi:class I SAM-dependent methyltransferase [Nesterenkonia aerolata]|uniref:Class I SAM-dependent methyltransferase n=1 Tax=Nesterenkonia aerolata TaxID=3074079 RepID=A0ABU2DNW9_9MICC|nr:class I SAM-dependent methyltransferase [Nesterenkonia sp. LY-0111]MDR8018010.1 class I SAM-dependent methyltransferase [Nesterenkonia sp. LY-0111]